MSSRSSSPSADPATGRLSNLLGAWALAVSDRVGAAAAAAAGRGGQAPAALVALHQFAGGSTIEELRQVLGLSHSAAVRLIDSLVADGHVARHQAADDRRSVALILTASGRTTARPDHRRSPAGRRGDARTPHRSRTAFPHPARGRAHRGHRRSTTERTTPRRCSRRRVAVPPVRLPGLRTVRGEMPGGHSRRAASVVTDSLEAAIGEQEPTASQEPSRSGRGPDPHQNARPFLSSPDEHLVSVDNTSPMRRLEGRRPSGSGDAHPSPSGARATPERRARCAPLAARCETQPRSSRLPVAL